MAVTKIHGITKTLNIAINYINNPMKTNYRSLVSGYNCESVYADLDFQMTRNLAKEIKGDYSKVGGNNILAYHMIQSFDPEDELTPEKAHAIGKKLADEFLDNKYEYVVSTHVDKDHIHNHIIFNATSFYDYNKFRSKPFITVKKIRNISDKLCLENNLNVILENKNIAKDRGEIEHIKRGTSWKEKIRNTIDYILENENPKNYKKFTALVKDHGIEIKEGKNISFKFKAEQKRFSRGKTLGNEYTRESLKKRIDEKNIHITITKRLIQKHANNRYYTKIPGLKKYISFDESKVQKIHKNKSIKVFIDPNKNYLIKDSTNKVIESVLGANIHKYYDDPKTYKVKVNKNQVDFSTFGDYIEYVNKEKAVASVHEMADLLNIIHDESITKLPDFEEKIKSLRKESFNVKETIKTLDQKNLKYKNVAKYLNTYNQYKAIKMKYEKQLPFFKKKYYQKHKSELKLFNRAEQKLNELGVNTNVDSKKIINLVEKQTNDIDKIKDDFDKLNKRLDQVRKGYNLANKILESDDLTKDRAVEKSKNKDFTR